MSFGGSVLIRGVAFGGSGIIKGVAFGGSGLIKGVAFGGSGIIRGVAFGGSGIIRGVAFGGSDLIKEGLVYQMIPILPVFDLLYTVAKLLSSEAQRSSLLKPQGVAAHDVSLLAFSSKQKHLDSLIKTKMKKRLK